MHIRKSKQILLLTLCASLFLPLCACSGKTPVSTTDVSNSSQPGLTTPGSSHPSGTIPDIPIFPSSSVSSDTPSEPSSPATLPPEPSTPPSSEVTTVPTTRPVVPGSLQLPVAPPSTDTRGLSDSEIFAFYNDAVFVGDSISLGWRNYVAKKRKADSLFFGGSNGAQFLVSGSLGAGNALWDVNAQSVHPTYQGSQMQLWNSIPLTGAKKVIVMFGLNDAALYGVDKTIENFGTLFGKIKANVPDVQFYVLSATYVKAGGEKGKLTSALLRELDLALINFCDQNGYAIINIADALADADGNLKAEYCSDGFVHQTTAAYDVWTALLKGYAAAQLAP